MRFLIPADKTALCLRALIRFPKKTVPQKPGYRIKPKKDLSVVVEIKTIKGYLTE